MSEAFALAFLQLLMTAFPPLAELFARHLPSSSDDPLVARVRAILPAEGASAAAARQLERSFFVLNDADDEEEP